MLLEATAPDTGVVSSLDRERTSRERLLVGLAVGLGLFGLIPLAWPGYPIRSVPNARLANLLIRFERPDVRFGALVLEERAAVATPGP